ncbi:hypothetical protein E5288_WYG020312 [Bos mutus]|uniref:Uncharacterized protein n=1 Tax=Bos mutus TaxID=72004 RepID=A0A6B0SAG5_9CETA|nr:hypothetical protein [Bos mutus]
MDRLPRFRCATRHLYYLEFQKLLSRHEVTVHSLLLTCVSYPDNIGARKKRKTLNVIKSMVPASIRTPMGVSSCLENARVRRNTAASSSFSIGVSTAAADTPHSIPEVLWGHRGISLKVEQVGETKLNSDMTGKCQRPFTWYHLRKEDNKDEEGLMKNFNSCMKHKL